MRGTRCKCIYGGAWEGRKLKLKLACRYYIRLDFLFSGFPNEESRTFERAVIIISIFNWNLNCCQILGKMKLYVLELKVVSLSINAVKIFLLSMVRTVICNSPKHKRILGILYQTLVKTKMIVYFILFYFTQFATQKYKGRGYH